MILHMPHSSREIPDNIRDQFVLSDHELNNELLLMTDAYTDELFESPTAIAIRFPLSRLVVDVERFKDDSGEPMARIGMGKIYERTADGRQLRRRLSTGERDQLVREHYEPHHRALRLAVEAEVATFGRSLIVDCHSFPEKPLPYEDGPSGSRPEFCIGTDDYHTPHSLTQRARTILNGMGFSVSVNSPFSGALVPETVYHTDKRVSSIMIEINRRLYMDEVSGEKSRGFDQTRKCVNELLESIQKTL